VGSRVPMSWIDQARANGLIAAEGPPPRLPVLPPPEGCRQDEFTTRVIQLAQRNGWLAWHPIPLWSEKGYRTGVQGDPGWMDVTAARLKDGVARFLVAELKRGRNPVTEAQERWLSVLRLVPGVEVYVWRPEDWPAIEIVLA
jgi:hypothetical protein